jgi:hypothetical protein
MAFGALVVVTNTISIAANDIAPPPFTSAAIDRDGNIYTAGGAHFEKWDADGKVIFQRQLQIGDAKPNENAYSIMVDEEFIYCTISTADQSPSNNRQQIRRFNLADGKPAPFTGPSVKSADSLLKPGEKPAQTPAGPSAKLLDGHIQLYEWPALQIPVKTPQADAALMSLPLRAIDVAGSTLYLADALGGKIRMFDTTTGLQKSDFDIHLPHAVAVDPLGQIWVAHNHDSITLYRADGYSGATYGGFGEITSLAFGPGAAIYATDSQKGQVLTLDISANPAKFICFLGSKAKEGEHVSDHFFNLLSVAADGRGNLITIDGATREHPARMAKWSSEKKLLWQRSASTPPEPGRN